MSDGEYNVAFGAAPERDPNNPYCKKGCTCGCHMMGDGTLCEPGERCFMCGCTPRIQPEGPEYTPFD